MLISDTRLKFSIKILYKKQNVNYNFQKHLFLMLVHTCILQIN